MYTPVMTETKTIVAVHGAGMQAGVWDALPIGYTALTLPGHGMGGAPLPTVEEMGTWLARQLDAYAAQSVVLMGHSMGALAVIEAARHPSVGALALMGAAAQMPVHPDLLAQAREAPDAAADLILKWGVSPGNAAVKAVLKPLMAAASGALFNDLNACNLYARGPAMAQGIGIPALVFAGADDKLTKPAAAEELALLMGAELCKLHGCGHMAMAESPKAVTQAVQTFIGLLPD